MMFICVGLFGHFQWEAELFGYIVCLFFGCLGHFVLIFSASSVCADWLFLHAHWPLRCCSYLSVFLCSVLECSPGLSPYLPVLFLLSQSAVKLIVISVSFAAFSNQRTSFWFLFLKSNSYLLINIYFYLFIIVIHFFSSLNILYLGIFLIFSLKFYFIFI